jgi:hypothetical protein
MTKQWKTVAIPIGFAVLVILGLGALRVDVNSFADGQTLPSSPLTIQIGPSVLLDPVLRGPEGSVEFNYKSQVDKAGNLTVTLTPKSYWLADTEYSWSGTIVTTLDGVSEVDCVAAESGRSWHRQFDGRKCVESGFHRSYFRTTKP